MSDLERDELEELEQSLAAELRPVPPPAGLADAVMFRIAQEKTAVAKSKVRGVPLRQRWSWFALAAAVLLMLLPAVYGVRVVREHRQAAIARARFDLAMRLTSRTLWRVDQTIDGALSRANGRTEEHSDSNSQESQP